MFRILLSETGFSVDWYWGGFFHPYYRWYFIISLFFRQFTYSLCYLMVLWNTANREAILYIHRIFSCIIRNTFSIHQSMWRKFCSAPLLMSYQLTQQTAVLSDSKWYLYQNLYQLRVKCFRCSLLSCIRGSNYIAKHDKWKKRQWLKF